MKPFVDERYRTRSNEERELVEIMESCWATDPDDRASIFEVVLSLQNMQDKIEKREAAEAASSKAKSNLG